MATITNLSQYVGEDKQFIDTILQPDGVTPQNIANWLLTFVVHAYGDPNVVYITLTIGTGLTVPMPTNGQVTITNAMANTLNMRPGLYQWFIQRTDSGNSAILSGGLFTLNAA